MTTPYKVEVRVRATAVSTGVTIVCEWSQSANNWGSAIETDGRDWATTNDTTEEQIACTTANAYYTWEINPALLDFSKTLYVRFRDINENAQNTRSTTIASQNNTTQAYRPQVIITFAGPAGGPPLRCLMGVGL